MWFPWKRKEVELEREVAHHLHEMAAALERQGYSRIEALQIAKREFGVTEQIKEECRDERRGAWLAGIGQDVAFGLRQMKSSPVVTIAAVLSLALGIGANTAVISLMDVVLWRALPVPQAEQLRLVYWQGNGSMQEIADRAAGARWRDGASELADFFSYPAFQAMRKGVADYASLAAFHFMSPVSVSFAGQPLVSQQRPVSGNFFSTLHVKAELGRLITDNDDQTAAAPVAVVSHRFWKDALHSDPNVVGQAISIDHRAYAIAGVVDAAFYGLVPGDGTEIYVPLHHGDPQQARDFLDSRYWGTSLILRIIHKEEEARVQPVMQSIFRASWSKQPKQGSLTPQILLEDGARGLGYLRGEFRNPLIVLGSLVGLLLVIACANIVNLLLARAVARKREVTVRMALGCSRGRLTRQFLTESFLLALFGGALSIVVGLSTANILGRFLAERDGQPITVSLDWHVLAAATLTTLLALLLFGVFPALRNARMANVPWGRQGFAGLGSRGRGRWNAGRLLVVGQMAMSVVLVISATVFIKNLVTLESSNPGFDRRNLILFNIRPGTSGYEKERLPQFYEQLEQRLASTPGVTAVGMCSMRPMNSAGWWDPVRRAGQQESVMASINGITPAYLPLLQPRLLAGRNITRADITSQAKVAVIGEDLAQRLGGASALGQLLEFPDGPPGAPLRRYQIVGIAPEMAVTSMKERPFAVWLPIENETAERTILLRTAQSPQRELRAIQQTVTSLDRNLPLVDVMTMEEQMEKGLLREKMFATLCGGFGGLALVLSVVGLFGVISYGTSQRRGEIGVRLALGATQKNVVAMILREGLSMVLMGIVLSAPAVILGARYAQKLITGMSPWEPGSIGFALCILIASAAIAAAVPAFRAAALQPSETLRQD
jgi:predicted permease